jgi:hypothetical protein
MSRDRNRTSRISPGRAHSFVQTTPTPGLHECEISERIASKNATPLRQRRSIVWMPWTARLARMGLPSPSFPNSVWERRLRNSVSILARRVGSVNATGHKVEERRGSSPPCRPPAGMNPAAHRNRRHFRAFAAPIRYSDSSAFAATRGPLLRLRHNRRDL